MNEQLSSEGENNNERPTRQVERLVRQHANENKHLHNLSLEWLRGVDVVHRPDVFATRVVLHTDGDRLYFSTIDFDKDGNIIRDGIDESPWSFESLNHSIEEAKVKIHREAPSVSLSARLGGSTKKRELVDILFPFALPTMIISVVVMLVVLVLEILRRIP